MKFKKYLQESVEIDIEVGDTILGGRFKNKKIKVKSIEYNERGEPIVNGKPLMKYRLIPKEDDEDGEILTELSAKKSQIKVETSSSTDFETNIFIKDEEWEGVLNPSGLRHFTFKAFMLPTEEFVEKFFGPKASDNQIDQAIMELDDIEFGFGESAWEVGFWDEAGIQKQQKQNRKIAMQVFSGVEESIKMFMSKYKPAVLYFAADISEPTRVKLYSFLARRIKKQGYEVLTNKDKLFKWVFVSKKAPDWKEIVDAITL